MQSSAPLIRRTRSEVDDVRSGVAEVDLPRDAAFLAIVRPHGARDLFSFMQRDLGDGMLMPRLVGDGKKLERSLAGLAVPPNIASLNCPRPPLVEVNLGLADDLLRARELLLGVERLFCNTGFFSTTHLALHGENTKGVERGAVDLAG